MLQAMSIRTESVRSMRRQLRILPSEADAVERPRSRGECEGGPRPCPLVACRYNLFLDVRDDGAIRFARPGVEPEDITADWSCALDVAGRGEQRRADIATAMGVVPERVRQIDAMALQKLRDSGVDLAALLPDPSRAVAVSETTERFSSAGSSEAWSFRGTSKTWAPDQSDEREADEWSNAVLASLRSGASLREALADANGEPMAKQKAIVGPDPGIHPPDVGRWHYREAWCATCGAPTNLASYFTGPIQCQACAFENEMKEASEMARKSPGIDLEEIDRTHRPSEDDDAKHTMTPKQQAADDGPRAFSVILSQCEDGALHAELSEKMQALAKKMARHAENYGSAKGTFTLKLSLSMDAMGTTQIDADIVIKEPKAGRARSVFWLNPSHNFLNENPRQTKLPLREVNLTKRTRDVLVDDRDTKSV